MGSEDPVFNTNSVIQEIKTGPLPIKISFKPPQQRRQPMQRQRMQGKPTPFSTDAKLGFGGAEIPALFSCMDDCDACLIGFGAPCVASGRIAEATGGDYQNQVMTYGLLKCCCGSVADCYHGFMLSKKLHEQYPTPGEEVNALAYCCCHCLACTGPCTKVQELRYLKNLKAGAPPRTRRPADHGPPRSH